MPMTLSPKQQRFVDEYLIDLNGTQAATRAGYSPKTANEQAARLLAKVSVAQAISDAQAKLRTRTGITQERVIQELAKIGFADIRKAVRWGAAPDSIESPYPLELVPSAQIDDDTAGAITEVSLTRDGVKIKLADKRAALETLLKHLGGLPGDDAQSLTVNVNTTAPVGDVRVTRHNG